MVNEADSRDSPAVDPSGRWMTLAEIAALRGISEASASRLVRRYKWRRQPDNRGVVRTLVPSGWEVWLDRRSDVQGSVDSPDGPGQISLAINTLHEAVSALREQLSRAEARREAERALADALRDRLLAMQEQLADAHGALQAAEATTARADRAERDKEQAEAGWEAERARADAIRDQVASLQAQLATAELRRKR
jgi:hypothetical protein